MLLQKASVKIIDTNTCNAEEAYNGRIVDTMLCAGYMEGNIDACQVSLEIIHKDHIMYQQWLLFIMEIICSLFSCALIVLLVTLYCDDFLQIAYVYKCPINTDDSFL